MIMRFENKSYIGGLNELGCFQWWGDMFQLTDNVDVRVILLHYSRPHGCHNSKIKKAWHIYVRTYFFNNKLVDFCNGY